MNERFKFRVPFFNNDNKFIGYEYCDMINGINAYNAGTCHKGDIQLSTGLKDRHGKLIYEGDIVRVNGYGVEGIFKMFWDDTTACFCTSIYDSDCFEHSQNVMEVIGNIYESKDIMYYG